MSSMMGRASSTFISRFSPLLFRDAITRSSLLIISCIPQIAVNKQSCWIYSLPCCSPQVPVHEA